ncbi:glycosyltransferase family 4 protein [Winogradskyella sp. R77965]|uniref:glycosyltransferase family 4 protein n=1 Tax=Winogradskyella sp. R77965 TaxID=3093872 RepID=UPI0037DD8574
MKIVWVTRSFLDYRIPVFKALKVLNKGEFTLIFNESYVPYSVVEKVKRELKESCIGLKGELTFGNKSTTNKWANKGLRIPFQPKLIKTIKSQKPDVIITDGFFQWTYAALWMRFFYKTKHVMCYERTAHTERNAQWYRISYRKFVSRWIDAICCTGDLCSKYVKSLGFKSNKVTTGHMVADIDTFFTDKLEKANILNQHKDKNAILYLYVGRIVEAKGINELLLTWVAFEKGKNVALYLVGDGPEREKYQDRLKELKLTNVFFIGRVSYDKVADYYQSANVFIIPTLEDNWSLVIPEAMASGLPILSSVYNGCYPEYITKNNGWVFDPLNYNDFLNKLNTSYFCENLNDMGNVSKTIISNYTPEKAALSIYNTIKLIKGKKQ